MKDAQTHAKRLRDLVQQLNSFADIERQIYLPDAKHTDRLENDVEHSYSLAMTSWYLSAFIPGLDQSKVIRFALAHDLVELHAGDVMAIGRTKAEEAAKEESEKRALKKLKADWPDFPSMTNTIEEYERKDCREAVFVYALDKILPVQLNILTKGKTWHKLDLDRSVVVKNKDEKTKVSPEIAAIWQELRVEVMAHDEYFNKGKR